MLRAYKTMNELTQDFWREHFVNEKRHNIPNVRLLEMSDDTSRTKKQRAMARAVWDNLWVLKNSNAGMCWLPEYHKRTIKYFKSNEWGEPHGK